MFKYNITIHVGGVPAFNLKNLLKMRVGPSKDITFEKDFLNPIKPGDKIRIGHLEAEVRTGLFSDSRDIPVHDMSNGVTNLYAHLYIPESQFDGVVRYLEKKVRDHEKMSNI